MQMGYVRSETLESGWGGCGRDQEMLPSSIGSAQAHPRIHFPATLAVTLGPETRSRPAQREQK